MSFAKRPGKDTPQCYVKPLDSLKNWNNWFFWVDERVFPTLVAWRSSAPRDNKPTTDSYSEADMATLNTHRTSFGQQPEDLLCLVGISRNYFFLEGQYPVFLDGSIWSDQEPEPQGEGRTPFAMEKSPLDFADEDVQMDVVGEHQTDKLVSTTVPQQEQPAAKSAATESVSEPEPLSFAVPLPTPEPDIAQSSKAATVEDEDTKKSSYFISMGGPPDDIYQPN
ncbi:hypothetical protein Tco_0712268 [Tanacetum coccineum]